MRGMILGYEESNGSGMIATDGGERFAFDKSGWKSQQAPMSGIRIDFSTADGRAVDIYPVPDTGYAGTGVAVKTPQAQQAFRLGAISLGCSVGGILIPFIGLILAIGAFVVGIKGFGLGRQSGEQAAVVMSVLGMIVAAITLLFYVVSLIFAATVGTGLGLLMR